MYIIQYPNSTKVMTVTAIPIAGAFKINDDKLPNRDYGKEFAELHYDGHLFYKYLDMPS